MKLRTLNQMFIALLAAAVAGCASAPSRFYTLDTTARADGTPDARFAVAVGPVTVPALVDRPQFTVQVGPNRVRIEEFNRWAAPLNDVIASVVAGNLAVLLGTPQVASARAAGLEPDFQVTIHVQRFESLRTEAGKNEAALIDAVWRVRRTADGAVRSGHSMAREPAEGEGFDALAAAHSRALAKVSADIAIAIQATNSDKP